MKKIILSTIAFITLYSCSSVEINEIQAEIDPNLTINFSEPPIETGNIGSLFAHDISYGTDERNKFDVFFAPSSTPTPLVIFIHGGGFVSGDKSVAYSTFLPDDINALLEQGISYATINYRLMEENDSIGMSKCFEDGKRCLQFIRHYSDILNVDPDRIALYGHSGGAGISLWLGLSDDMAEPSSPDPILHESTRVNAVGAWEMQATYDLVKWETEVFDEYGFTLDIASLLGMEEQLALYYGLSSFDDLFTPEITDYRTRFDLLSKIDDNDPDLWLNNSSQPDGIPASQNQFLHHPVHAQLIHNYAEGEGLTNVSYVPMLGISDPSGQDMVSFFAERLLY